MDQPCSPLRCERNRMVRIPIGGERRYRGNGEGRHRCAWDSRLQKVEIEMAFLQAAIRYPNGVCRATAELAYRYSHQYIFPRKRQHLLPNRGLVDSDRDLPTSLGFAGTQVEFVISRCRVRARNRSTRCGRIA